MRSRLSTTLVLAAALCAAPAAAQAADVIVAFKKGATPAERAAVHDAHGVLGALGAIHGLSARVLRVAGSAPQASAELARRPGVKYAEPNMRVTTGARRARPNDPDFGRQPGLNSPGDFDIDAPEGWALARLASFPGSGGVPVGVVDTGVDAEHPELAGQISGCAQSGPRLLGGSRFEAGYCPDTQGHGTHVGGIIAAAADNGRGIAGVAFNANLLVCRALGESGLPIVGDVIGPGGDGSVADVAACINWVADNGAKVISMSFEAEYSNTIQAAVNHAWRGGKGAVLVAAAGNEGAEATMHPAGAKQVISVAATTDHDKRASFSNVNQDVELAAPGEDILSLLAGGGYTTLSGTSQATPQVAGVAAIVRRLHPAWTAKQVRRQLDKSADDLGPKGRDSSFGFGRVNLCNAVGGDCPYKGR